MLGYCMNDLMLLKPNELINVISELELSRNARHILNYFLRHAQRKIKLENFEGNTFSINYSELNKLADINPESIDVMKNSLRHLMKPVVLRDDPQYFSAIVPVTYVNIDKINGEYVYSLENKVIDLLKKTDYYTKLDLKEFNVFKSKHSIVIFEYMKRYENMSHIPILTIDELRKMTDTKDKYPNFKHLQQKVLDIAVHEINTFTNYQISYELIKIATQRRPKVNEIQFYFSKKSKLEKEQAIDNEFNDELFLNFRQIFKNLPIEDYKHACDTFERSTLVRFYNDLKNKSYSSLKTECFLRYLLDRTNKKWNGYLYKTQNKTPKEEAPGQTSGSFGGDEKFNFDEYLEKERQKFFDV